MQAFTNVDQEQKISGLSRLYEAYYTELASFIRTKVGRGPPEVEDIIQQIFLEYSQQSEKQKITNARAYLYRIAANIIYNYFRRAGVERQYAQAQLAEEQDRPVKVGLDAENMLLNKQQLLIVQDVIGKMPARQRRVFLLHRLDHMSYREIARRERLSNNTVKRDVLKAMAELNKAIVMADAEIRNTVSDLGDWENGDDNEA